MAAKSHGSSEEMLLAAKELVGRYLSERDFRSHFGGPSLAIEKLWQMILKKNDLPHLWGIDDLFMGLFFLQNPGNSWSTNSSRWGIHPNTFKKHLVWTLSIIVAVLPEVIILFKLFYLIFIFRFLLVIGLIIGSTKYLLEFWILLLLKSISLMMSHGTILLVQIVGD